MLEAGGRTDHTGPGRPTAPSNDRTAAPAGRTRRQPRHAHRPDLSLCLCTYHPPPAPTLAVCADSEGYGGEVRGHGPVMGGAGTSRGDGDGNARMNRLAQIEMSVESKFVD